MVQRQQCVAECPVEAIFQDDDVPVWQHFIQLNAEMAQKCSEITEQKPPISDNTS